MMRSLVTIFTAAAGIYMLSLLPAIAANCVPLTLLTAKSEAPFLLSKTTKSLDAKTQVSGWGKAGLSVREAIFFGAFEMCLTTAKEVVFR